MRYMEKGDSYVNKKFVSITNITYKGDAEILTSNMVHYIGFYAKGFLDALLNSKGYTNVSDIPRLESYLENVDWDNIIDPYSPLESESRSHDFSSSSLQAGYSEV